MRQQAFTALQAPYLACSAVVSRNGGTLAWWGRAGTSRAAQLLRRRARTQQEGRVARRLVAPPYRGPQGGRQAIAALHTSIACHKTVYGRRIALHVAQSGFEGAGQGKQAKGADLQGGHPGRALAQEWHLAALHAASESKGMGRIAMFVSSKHARRTEAPPPMLRGQQDLQSCATRVCHALLSSACGSKARADSRT